MPILNESNNNYSVKIAKLINDQVFIYKINLSNNFFYLYNLDN